MLFFKKPLIIISLSGVLAVAMGAWAAHGLQAWLAEADIARIEKAAQYQMYHTLALLGVVALFPTMPRHAAVTALAFVAGIVAFCGSLYIYSFTHWPWLMLLTPLGGLSFMFGWLTLAFHALRR